MSCGASKAGQAKKYPHLAAGSCGETSYNCSTKHQHPGRNRGCVVVEDGMRVGVSQRGLVGWLRHCDYIFFSDKIEKVKENVFHL